MEDRKLTEKEKKRLLDFEKTKQDFLQRGYEVDYLSDDINKLVIKGSVLAFIIVFPFLFLFDFKAGLNGYVNLDFVDGEKLNMFLVIGYRTISMILGFVLAVVFHELVHGFFFGLFARDFKSISFGFVPSQGIAYATGSIPITKWQYMIVLVMPLIVTGLVPMIVGTAMKSFLIFFIGAAMTMGAAGDICMMLILGKYREKAIFLDHPTQVGLVAFRK